MVGNWFTLQHDQLFVLQKLSWKQGMQHNITWQLEEGIIHFTLNLTSALWYAGLPQPLIHRLSCDDVVSCVGWSFPFHHDCGCNGANDAQEGQREAEELYACTGHRLISEKEEKVPEKREKFSKLSWCSSSWFGAVHLIPNSLSTCASSGETPEERRGEGGSRNVLALRLMLGGAGRHLVGVMLSCNLTPELTALQWQSEILYWPPGGKLGFVLLMTL